MALQLEVQRIVEGNPQLLRRADQLLGVKEKVVDRHLPLEDAGALTLGWSVHDAMELASAYVADTIAETRREPDARWYGVSFEATIPQLLRRMAQRRPSHAEN